MKARWPAIDLLEGLYDLAIHELTCCVSVAAAPSMPDDFELRPNQRYLEATVAADGE